MTLNTPNMLRTCRHTARFCFCALALHPAFTAAAFAASANLRASADMPEHAGAMDVFLSGMAGKTIFVSVLFLGVMLFLRLLYGPKGWLREKRWDEMNVEFKAAEEKSAAIKTAKRIHKKRRVVLAPLLAAEGEQLSAYAESFFNGSPQNDKPMGLKLEHSANVLKNAWIIAAREEVFYGPAGQRGNKPELDRALLLAALYHDVGRFEQVKRFGTFKDADSLNHGLLGASILSDPRFMSAETAEMRKLVRGAVLMHNRLALPAIMPRPLELVLKGVRDADKLDIINIMREEISPGKIPDKTVTLGLEDAPGQYSDHAFEAVLSGVPVEYAKMRYVNDFRLLLCSWVASLEFAASKQILARRGYMEEIMSGLPQNGDMEKVRNQVRELLGQ